jgi:hypothetical protein
MLYYLTTRKDCQGGDPIRGRVEACGRQADRQAPTKLSSPEAKRAAVPTVHLVTSIRSFGCTNHQQVEPKR